MSILISSDKVAACERREFINATMSEARMVPVEFQPADPSRFWVELRYDDLGAVRVMQLSATPFQTRRTPVLIQRSAPDLLSLSMVLSGRGNLRQYGRDAHAEPGTFCLQELNRPYRIGQDLECADRGGAEAVRALQLTFPRSLLPLPPKQLKRLAAVPLGPGSGVGSLTSQLLMQFAAGMDEYTPAEAARLSAAALDVLATRLAHELDGHRWVPPETHKRALLVRIHAFIQLHLGDPELSPGAIAAAHHVSPRTLHALFRGQGETVAGWIRRRRLEAARRELSDPRPDARPVAAIAARCGFSSASRFTQAFRAAYGMPPTAYRQRSRTGGGGAPRGT